MAVCDVGYVELYVTEEDEEPSLHYLGASFGFSVVARASAGNMNSVLLRQGDASVVVSTGPGTDEFLAAHGEGVADIALICDDMAGAEAAVVAGARRQDTIGGLPALIMLGDVRHTLLPGSAYHRGRLADGRQWTPVEAAAPLGCIKRLDHIAVCAEPEGMAQVAGCYRPLGFENFYSEYVEVGEQAMDSLVIRAGGAVFTMLEPDTGRKPGQIDDFLARNCGAGVQHLAFEVTGIIAAVREYRDRGIEFLAVPPAYYESLMERMPELDDEISELRRAHVLADRDAWGQLLQLFTRPPHRNRTLFYELIERRGARCFGSTNIRELYKAVEREHLIVAQE